MYSGRHSLGRVLVGGLFGLAVLAGWALFTGAPVAGPAHDLGGVAVDNLGFESRTVEVQVYRDPVAGERERVAAETVTVPAADHPTPGEDGAATGVSVAGRARVTPTWETPGNFDVRIRLDGRETWATVDLGAADRANDEAWWRDLLDRYDDFEEIECLGVTALVDRTEPGGVEARATNCRQV